MSWGLWEKRNFASGCTELFQVEGTECGAISLKMVMDYYGVIISIEELRDICQVSRDGSRASALLKAARRFGFTAQGYRAFQPEDILKYPMPVILFWEFNHFLVCLGKKGKYWVVNDPANGQRFVTDEEMNKSFTGILLSIKPGDNFKRQGKRLSLFRTLFPLTTCCRGGLLLLFILGLLTIPLTVAQPNMDRFLIDYFFQDGYHHWGPPILCIGIFLLLATIGAARLQHHLLLSVNMQMSIRNSCAALKKLFSMPYQFFQSRFSGELANRISYSQSISNFLSEHLIHTLLDLLSLVFFAYLLIVFDSVLGGFAVIMAVITLGIMWHFQRRQHMSSNRITQEEGKLIGCTSCAISLIEFLKASGMEDDFFVTWSDFYKEETTTRNSSALLSIWLTLLPAAVQDIGLACIIAIGANRILLGHMSSGTFIAFQLILGCFFAPLISLVEMGKMIQYIRSQASRLLEVFHYPVKDQLCRKDGKQAVCSGKSSGTISIRGLVFGYNRNLPPVIDHLDLDVAAGERIAIVGTSGSGKSTIARLLAGAYEPWEGEILFDGRPRHTYSVQELRYFFAMVDQEIIMFPGTLLENLSLFDNALPFSSIKRAAEDALIHDAIISRNGGYYSRINASGSNFSGGECQRLEIARALAVDPAILVLDEATAALDALNEAKLDGNLRRRGITTIVIAHRLSTIRDADRIIVLDGGRIAESGTHDELMKKNGIYAGLVSV